MRATGFAVCGSLARVVLDVSVSVSVSVSGFAVGREEKKGGVMVVGWDVIVV
jgi:hypothetical protein